jgi:hypothetical protein
MIVDYNYFPYVETLPAPGVFSITPRSKNNKGFIYVVGSGDNEAEGDILPSSIVCKAPNGTDITISNTSSIFNTGSFKDMFMQFKRMPDASLTTTLQTTDINILPDLVNYSGVYKTAIFFPVTYKQINFSLSSTVYFAKPILITLF